MNILFVSWFFPPNNDVAALRTGATVHHLTQSGHQVHVLSARRAHADKSLAVPISESSISRTAWFDIDALRPGASEYQAPSAKVAGPPRAKRPKIFTGLSDARSNFTHIPDRQTGWRSYAIREGRQLIRDKNIQAIIASAPPFTGLVVANALAREFEIPWIAEYRDAWSRYTYTPRYRWRQWLDEIMENRTISSATAIIASTEPWAEYYKTRFGKPTIAIYNGYDVGSSVERARAKRPGEPLIITYVGGLYGGIRDPTALYEAISASSFTPADLRIRYYGPSEAEVWPLAIRSGVREFIELHSRVSHAQSLEIQYDSDVLLLLQSPDDPRNVPAKVFEYFAVARPILGIGLDHGIPAELVRKRNAGLYSSDPRQIGLALEEWSAIKKRDGYIPDLPERARAGLSRSQQLARLTDVLALLDQTPS